MDSETRIIEVGGVKMEVDMRHARRIDTFRIGQPVKVLIKNYSEYESHPGVIVGFDGFEKLPTIVVAYVKTGYQAGELKFAYFNAQSKDMELCAVTEMDVLPERERILAAMDREIEKARGELEKVIAQRRYFAERFGAAFGLTALEMPPIG